jgi:hypothetical protein
MRIKYTKNKVNFKRRLYLLKSNIDRLVVRISNRSVIVQRIKGGYNSVGDNVLKTWLYHKYEKGSVNVLKLENFLKQISEGETFKNTILDLGNKFKNKGGLRIKKVIEIHNAVK